MKRESNGRISRIDLHNHSRYSGDNDAEPEELIEAAIEIGLDGIAFTEHDSYSASEVAGSLAARYTGAILILRGIEYSSADGHLLIFGIGHERFLPAPYAPARAAIAATIQRGGVVVIPHPFRGWSMMKEDIAALEGISAIETCNGRNAPEENELAEAKALQLGLPATGGSDAHSGGEVGRCYTEFSGKIDYENFLEALRTGNYRAVKKMAGRLG